MKTIFLSLIFTTISSLGTSLSNAQTVAAPLTATQEATQKGQENFSIGKNTFLLNGKPIVIKAAEIHYPRTLLGTTH